MMFALQYFREQLSLILKELLFVCIFGVIFYLYRLPLAAVWYPAGLCALVNSLFWGASFYKACERHRKLEDLRPQQRIAVQDAFAEYGTAQEDDRQIILGLCEEMRSLEERMSDSYQEMIGYFTIWVHQIKTPIASMRLRLGAEDSELSRRLSSDLLHIEQYVEMVLTYFKMGSETTDYVFGEVSLDKVIRENIRKLRGDFIIKKLNLQYMPSEETVISDEKWLSFVVEQVLSNALKYTSQGTVSVYVEEPDTLCVHDTGIGIAPEDIPRIFQKGYTGGNGRMDKRASGLGLYLCRQICSRLGAEISVESQIEAGTTVRIDLSQTSARKEYR